MPRIVPCQSLPFSGFPARIRDCGQTRVMSTVIKTVLLLAPAYVYLYINAVYSLKSSHLHYREPLTDLVSQMQETSTAVQNSTNGGHPSTSVYRALEIDHTKASHSLWSEDAQCSKFLVNFGKNIEGTLLLSFPRSGNTWTRYLLEGATGIFTSSVFNDPSLTKAGFLGEVSSLSHNNTIVTKYHFLQKNHHATDPCILLIRNPIRAIASLWAFKIVTSWDVKHVAVIDNSRYNTSEFRNFYQNMLNRWMDVIRNALENSRLRLLPMYYEQLREDPIKEVRRMLNFLRLKPNEERLVCVARHITGKMKGGQKKFNPYTKNEMNQAQEAVKIVNNLLVKRGLPPLPDYSKYEN
ncbi:WSC domain-containing protein 1-like [Homarus americanus]|uniref:WSC domain-containing protein 1-like n=1 Tax=Homarus americanus TaxID=6706 RepID=UPI001C47B392|nr:WSC domain-containing protein 1-like [Homarus americanus]